MTSEWQIVLVALIAAVPATLAAITGVITALKINSVHHQMNSMKDQLVASTAKASFAEGVIAEKENRA